MPNYDSSRDKQIKLLWLFLWIHNDELNPSQQMFFFSIICKEINLFFWSLLSIREERKEIVSKVSFQVPVNISFRCNNSPTFCHFKKKGPCTIWIQWCEKPQVPADHIHTQVYHSKIEYYDPAFKTKTTADLSQLSSFVFQMGKTRTFNNLSCC